MVKQRDEYHFDDDVLEDGRTLRTPMYLMDAVRYDENGPHFLRAVDAAARDDAVRARQEMIDRAANAWRTPPANFVPSRDEVVRDAAEPDPEELAMRRHLAAEPDIEDAEAMRRKAYEGFVERQKNAWKTAVVGPGPGVIGASPRCIGPGPRR